MVDPLKAIIVVNSIPTPKKVHIITIMKSRP